MRGLALILLALAAREALAGHPFITDDADTQGQGRQQIEFNSAWLRLPDTRSRVASFTYSLGAKDNLDLFVDLPLGLAAPAGVGNVSLGVKWRFLEAGPTRLAFKPELLLPSSGENKGLGSGGPGFALTLIASHDAGRWQAHGNAGLVANRYEEPTAVAANRALLWRISAGAAYAVTPRLSALADIGAARNPAANSNVSPAFALVGLIYSPRRNLDLDIGMKFGLTRAEVDRQTGIGLTWRFY